MIVPEQPVQRITNLMKGLAITLFEKKFISNSMLICLHQNLGFK